MDVSVIIVNYNTCRLLDDCLQSIYAHTSGIAFEVLVSDNQSVDGSMEMVEQKYPQVICIRNEGNLGFGKANNVAIRQAKGKYLFLLNSDTVLLNNAIQIFHQFMTNQQDKIGALGCWLLDEQRASAISYGEFPSVQSEFNYLIGKIFHLHSPKDYQTKEIKEVDFITGADLFIPSEVLKEIGLFDEQFFMYFEETDLQIRMQSRGYKRLLIPGPEIIHLEGGSMEQPQTLTYKRLMMNLDSFKKYQKKHFQGIHYIYYRIVSVLLRTTLFFNKQFSVKEKMTVLQTLLKK